MKIAEYPSYLAAQRSVTLQSSNGRTLDFPYTPNKHPSIASESLTTMPVAPPHPLKPLRLRRHVSHRHRRNSHLLDQSIIPSLIDQPENPDIDTHHAPKITRGSFEALFMHILVGVAIMSADIETAAYALDETEAKFGAL